jgi:ATP synthase protein I
VIAVIAGIWDGWQRRVSASLGGRHQCAGGRRLRAALGHRRVRPASSERTLAAMFRAEGAKILLIIAGLWLSLSLYKDLVPAAFFTAFVVTVVVFSMAIMVRDS